MVENIIEIHDLTKIYKLKKKNRTITAIDKLNFDVKRGETFGFLGPNGAGKTTTVSILTTLFQPTSGTAIVNGYDVVTKPNQVRSKISLMSGSDMLYNRLTAYANLRFISKLYGIKNYKKRINDLIEEFELKKWLHEYISLLSTGMKTKLAMCRALLIEPEILFLDEPTIGLDVQTTEFVINRLKEFDRTIFLTSHNMNVVEKLCKRIAFINKGKLIKIGTKEELRKAILQRLTTRIELQGNEDELIEKLEQQSFVIEVEKDDKGILISLKERRDYKALLSILAHYDILKIAEVDPSVEDLFLTIYQK